MPISADAVIAQAMENPVNAALMQRLPGLGLPQCFLTAGCLFQAVWNRRSGQPSETSVKDYDVFYFDDRDLSWEAEDAVIREAAALCADLGAPVEIKNQARVHLWYKQRFGSDYPQLRSATEGIDRYLVQCTCIGIEVATGRLYAPNGLEDMADGVLRPNPLNPSPELFRAKCEAYRVRWPWLTIAE
ncbi:MAG: nucleotidyltransferase family protein [Inquilinus sp.]|uniref:nucleotidyltransferase family protein n=1 Tax=Inquilinus sp. TaxID=1932117 RepID=UPI003F2F77CB